MTTGASDPSRSPDALLREMLDCMSLIQRYLQGQSEAGFRQDQEKQDAVARRLEILGEAARQLPAEWKAQHTGAPWRVIADMRNRLIHGYFSVDVGIVWRTVTQDLAPVEQELRRILAHEYPNSQP